MTILLTGFEPFGGAEVNSSWEVAAALSGMIDNNQEKVFARKLPVSFKQSGEDLICQIKQLNPDLILMFGQAGQSNEIRIERVALNLMDARNPDNDGYCPTEEMIATGEPAAYFTTFPVRELAETLTANGIPATVSNSAGLYVCNRVYYEALHHIESNKLSSRALFIHLPKISDEWTVERLVSAGMQIFEKINHK